MSFGMWLEEHEKKNHHIKKIDIFDFDDTLVFSPTRDQARNIIDQHNAHALFADLLDELADDLNHKSGYWYMSQSLEPPIVPTPAPFRMLNKPVVRDFFSSARDPKRLTVVMTGRPPHLEKQVRRILDDFRLKPDRLMLMPKQGHTVDHKCQCIQNMLDELPQVMDIEVWDDRGPKKSKLMGKPEENHIKMFKDLLEKIHKTRTAKHPAYILKYKVNEIDPRDEIVYELMRKNPKYGVNPDEPKKKSTSKGKQKGKPKKTRKRGK